jgi:Holliday junction resolvasome RuvABC endonuclease subunit
MMGSLGKWAAAGKVARAHGVLYVAVRWWELRYRKNAPQQGQYCNSAAGHATQARIQIKELFSIVIFPIVS